LGLHDLARYLSERETGDYLCRKLKEGAQFFPVELPRVLDDFAKVRNVAAHHKLVEREIVVYWRNRLCGVGCEGVLVKLARVTNARSKSDTPDVNTV
jgi:hypothetical protein